ncbi:MAG: pyridoxal-phosphate dependent enzyme [Polyangiaceae bacterium]|nr:pyridoxal-phosphate dependent enzyme [Polyangiaceae bacterium]
MTYRSSSASSLSRRAWLALVAAACTPAGERRTTDRSASSSAEGALPTTSAVAETPPPARVKKLDHPWIEALGALPRLSLGDLPTPIEEAQSLAKAIGVGELWLKRDDLSSRVFGGGKVRKLERLFGDARALGRTHVVTFGAVGSNHAAATAAFGVRNGFSVTVHLAGQPKGPVVRRNLALCIASGARIEASSGLADTFAKAVRDAGSGPEADRPYVIAPGGTCHVGNVGMVDAAFELAEQIQLGLAPAPDDIVVAMGTMGSTAGLAFGLAAAGIRARIIAVRCSSEASSSKAALRKLEDGFEHYLESIGAKVTSRAEVDVESRYLGRGYGRPTREGERAIALAKEHAGIELESTYTAKALAALMGRARDLEKRRVLFWASQPAPLAFDPGAVERSALPEALRPYLDD